MDKNFKNVLKELECEYKTTGNYKAKETFEVINSPIVKLLNEIINKAYKMNASDIHLEPIDHMGRIRYRLDGELYELINLDINILNLLISRLKVISKIELSNNKLPQEGRIDFLLDKKSLDLRISIMPTIKGEKAVIRILNKDGLILKKEKLGFSESDLLLLQEIMKKDTGLILITGPTGSGKTTTAYALLEELNKSNKNIITIEDPVEYKIKGITQIQVDRRGKLDFKLGLKSILRQDPDIIFLGEIRDEETARTAISAASTGHFVIATLHTNNSIATIARLLDIGIEKYLIASGISGIVSQRLLRVLCPKCKSKYRASPEEKEILGLDMDKNFNLYREVGCKECNKGYLGRQAAYEVLNLDKNVKNLILGDLNRFEILEKLERYNRLDLEMKKLVVEGVTSIDEFIKINMKFN